MAFGAASPYKNGHLERVLGIWALGEAFGAVSLYKNGHLEWFLGLWALGVHLVLFLLIKMVTWRGFWASGREQLIGFVILLG